MLQMPTPRPRPAPKGQARRHLATDAKPMPTPEIYKQSNGPLWLYRYPYNGVWISGVADTEAKAVDLAEQFYMRETAQGRLDSVIVVE